MPSLADPSASKTGNSDFTDPKFNDQDLVATVMQMVQLEFLELELIQQETNVSNQYVDKYYMMSPTFFQIMLNTFKIYNSTDSFLFQDEIESLTKQNEDTKEKLFLKRQQNQRFNDIIFSLKSDLVKLKEEETKLYSIASNSTKNSCNWTKRLCSFFFKTLWIILNMCSFVFFLFFIFIELDCDRLNCNVGNSKLSD